MNTTTEIPAIESARQYVRRIRNPKRKEYAVGYLAHRINSVSDIPRHSLPFMAAQGIRLSIDQILTSR